MGVVPDEEIKKEDDEIAALVKEIGDLVGEFKSAAEEDQRAELINKITEKEKDLRAVRQKKGQFRAVLSRPTKMW
jgi:Sec-independent protein translocase protein TatA